MRRWLMILLSLSISPVFAEPANLSFYKQELTHYHDSGQYHKELLAVTQEARAYLAERLQQQIGKAHPQRLAVVFDIDETVLSNYPDMKRLNFGGSVKDIKQHIGAAHDDALQETLELYRYVLKQPITIFFVTGREARQRRATEANLLHAGYRGWQQIFFKPNHYLLPSIIPYKKRARRKITEMGYTIIATIGDQYSDLRGGYAERGFKLPNPYYYLP